MTNDNSTKVALVVGSGKRRVGYFIAERLARSGYTIAVHYNHSRDDAEKTLNYLRSYQPGCEAFQADVTEEPQVERLVDEVYRKFGRIDLLVTAQGSWPKISLEDTHAADLYEQFSINTAGYVAVSILDQYYRGSHIKLRNVRTGLS